MNGWDGAAFDRWLTTEPDDGYSGFCEENDLDPDKASSERQYESWLVATEVGQL